MNAPAQLALPVWLEGRDGIQRQIRERVRENYLIAVESKIEVFWLEAGWSAVLRLPQIGVEDKIADRLLRESDVIVHPGSFYGIAETGRVVVSLIVPMREFVLGMSRVGKAALVEPQ